ncbi:MAG TPA: hypothetical protein VNO32_63145 [Candidatus Acidoferrum sp.]|jgi:hypothetical protein|nr:hypothetical protein [Candidatus Acidoferrum sp.]
MSELERVVRAILRSMRAKPAFPLQAYQAEVAVLTHAVAARSHEKPDDADTTVCIIGGRRTNKSTKQEP